MDFDEEPLDMLEDDGDGVNDMCLFFDGDGDKRNKSTPPQGNGCSVILLCMATGAASGVWCLIDSVV